MAQLSEKAQSSLSTVVGMAILSGILISGCMQTGSADATPMWEKEHDGRIYVLGSQSTYEKFEDTHHLPYTRTLIGHGPQGETVILEVSKDDPELAGRLEQAYNEKNRFYAETERDGKIYVIGSPDMLASFESIHHLPYTHTRIGYGPAGETVIFEVDKDNPHYQNRLIATYNSLHRYYAEEAQHGRIYVIGNEDTHQSFKNSHHLPYTKTLIGAGPQGQTLVFEVDKSDASLSTRLMSDFAWRHSVAL